MGKWETHKSRISRDKMHDAYPVLKASPDKVITYFSMQLVIQTFSHIK
jgi:hypothetical protein